MFDDGRISFGIGTRFTGLLLAIFTGIAFGQNGGDAKLPDLSKVPAADPVPLKSDDLETDAAFAGTWQLVEVVPGHGPKVGDRIVVEETVVDHGPDQGRSAWNWHQPGPAPVLVTHWTIYVDWAPERTPAQPWPIIELSRQGSHRMGIAEIGPPRSRAIYHLRGDLLFLAYETKDGRLPIDFVNGSGQDVEVWRRIEPPVTRLEPESLLDGRWQLERVTFHLVGLYPAAQVSVPDHLAGTKGPDSFLKDGTIFEVKDGAWREDGRGDAGLGWTSKRELRLPRRLYTRMMPDPRPAGVPAEEFGMYRLQMNKLTLTFQQQWLDTDQDHPDHGLYLCYGMRIETYKRVWTKPAARKP